MSIYEQYYADKENAAKRFDTYGYGPPPKDGFTVNGVRYHGGEDFRTVERYEEYKDVGFNILLSQTSAAYNSTIEWETSDLKMVMDKAYEAGLGKVLLLDDDIRRLSLESDGLIGEGRKFQSEEELDAYIANCIAPYKDHPAFYGVTVKDEPGCANFKAIGQVIKSMKRVCPTAFVQCNLLPIVVLNGTNRAFPDDWNRGGDLYDRYEQYLEAFLDESEADYVMYDNYPIYDRDACGYDHVFYRFWFRALQIAAKVCSRRKVKLYYVMQSFGMLQNLKRTCQVPTEAEVFYQMNAILGFAVRQVSFYTYWSSKFITTTGEARPEKDAMISWYGERQPVYYSVQKAIAMAQKLAPVLFNFEYVSDRYIIKTPFKTRPIHLEYTTRGVLNKVVNATTNQEVALINELYDEKRKQWLYRVENISHCCHEDALEDPMQHTTLKFAPEFTKVDVFDGEAWKTVELVNGEYTCSVRAGYAEYLLPY